MMVRQVRWTVCAKLHERTRKRKFTALLHHVDVDRLRRAYWAINPKAATGVDGLTWGAYGQDLEANLEDLHARLHRGAYRASPSRRVYIPKPDGRLRPLGIATLEDKIVQRAVVEVLNAIYEEDFLGFSYGFRPGRSPHDALDALAVGIEKKKVNWILDADIRGFYDAIDHEWLGKFVEHRIADKRVLRIIQKWLNAGVIEDGSWSASEEGAPQGASASPLLANVYLHYVFDLWARQWRKRHAHGEMIIVRFADDIVVGFQYRSDAKQFQEDLVQRFARFNLELNAEKTRLIEFGRFAAENRRRHHLGRPETFSFLGFTHMCGKTRDGTIRVAAQDDHEADGGQAARGERLAPATSPLAHPRAGAVARQRGARAYRLLRSAGQHRSGVGVPQTGHATLAQGAPAPEPASPPDLGADGPARSTMAPCSPHHASLAERSVRRPHPRQEPSAVVPLAGICPGGRPQGRSLPGMFDLDVRAFFDSVPHDLLLKAVAHHTDERWVLLYIERWLKAPMQMPDGTQVAREKGTPQGSPISPLLANLFMHYAFDRWMDREYPGCPFERYADDAVIHCDTEAQARSLWAATRRAARVLGTRAAPREDEGRVLQGRAPPRGLRAHQLRFPRLHLSGTPGERPTRALRELLSGHEHQREEGDRQEDQGLAPQPSQWHGPVRPRPGDQSPGPRLDQVLRGLLPLRVVLPRTAHQRASGPMGNAEVQTFAKQAGQGLGLARCC